MSENMITAAMKQATSGSGSGTPEGKQSSNVVHASESTEDKGWGLNESTDGTESQPNEGSPDTGADSDTAQPEAGEEEAREIPTKETITISDDKGRRKIEIDYSNRTAIKKAFELAHGARKWQSERDAQAKEAATTKAQLAEIQATFGKLEQAFSEGGEAGVLDLLAGKEGAHKEWAKRTLERERLAEKDPEAYQRLLEREEFEKLKREVANERAARAKDKEEILATKDAADMAALESNIHPSYDKYRFDGKLGDADAEQIFDEMLWKTTLTRLEPYEAQNKLTRQVIDEKFREVSTMLRKQMGQQVEKKVAKVVEQKKQEATSNAQAAVLSGHKTGGVKREAAEMLQKGDLTGIFRNWGKLKGAFK